MRWPKRREDACRRTLWSITAAGRTFIAGADITEFNKPPTVPTTSDVIDAIDAMPKPVVAALHWHAVGWRAGDRPGLSFPRRRAGNQARPAGNQARPDAGRGAEPSACRASFGMDKAMAMILSGDPIDAEDALSFWLGRRDRFR